MKDHYVSQTYLRKFVGADGTLIPYYKERQVVVGRAKSPKSLCYEADGDSNPYFEDSRILDEFLPVLENAWSKNVDNLEQGYMEENLRCQVSGYIAFLRYCNPTMIRLGKKSIEGILQPLVDEAGKTIIENESSKNMGTESLLRSLFKKGEIRIDVDPKFAHAHGVWSLLDTLKRLYCSPWKVFINETDTPFITSDYPATLWYPLENVQVAHTYVPISRTCAIVIATDEYAMASLSEGELRYDPDQDTFGVIKQAYVEKFNRLIIKSAENVVLHQNTEAWLEELVRKYRAWRMEATVTPAPDGHLTIIQIRPKEVK